MLARYRVESKLGEGGMGVVWKATDVTLHRTVALKLLPEAFARDPERVARFEREARMLASLNHPNIAAIYGLDTDGPLRVLAMEFVPGDTLAFRITRGALPINEAIGIALKIAEALESAHERGIVHRDLKPANVAVTPEGDVKLLDFGLARAFAPDGEITSRTDDSPTISAVMTRGDVILGTAAYMSPEQARGKLVDRRSDIWSFGLVVFEMLTGKRVFEGETTSDLLAAVLRQDVPWERLPKATPPHVRALLERCLTRDPRERLRDIGEARIVLASAPSGRAPTSRRAPKWAAWALGTAVLLAVAAWFGGRAAKPAAPAEPTRRFQIAPVADPKSAAPAISPDGKLVAYVDRGQLWVRPLDQLEPRALADDADARRPFWSPDSKSIGFLSATHVRRVPAAGGPVETIGEMPSAFGVGGDGGAWMEDGHVLVTHGMPDGLIELPERGGEARGWLAADTTKESDFHEPALLPGGRGVLVVVHRKEGADNVTLVKDGKRQTLLLLPGQLLRRPQYTSAGYIVFERTTPPAGIWAVPFSLASLRTTGDPFLVASGGVEPSVADDGTLIYVATPSQSVEFCWLDRAGTVLQHLATLGPTAEDGGVFDLSPDGTRAVATFGTAADLWVYDLVRGSNSRLTTNPGLDVNPLFLPDGKRILYQTAPAHMSGLDGWAIVVQASDGSGAPDTLLRGATVSPGLSKDGRTLYYSQIDAPGVWTIYSRPFAGGTPTALSDTRHVAFAPRPSPDGRWLAYCQSDVLPNGHPQVVIQSLATGTRTIAGTGLWPKWNERGDRLYFVQRDDVMELKIGAGDPPVTGPPVRLFTRPAVEMTLVFDWTPQFEVRGDKFLVLRPVGETRSPGLVMVQNWSSEFARVATSRRP